MESWTSSCRALNDRILWSYVLRGPPSRKQTRRDINRAKCAFVQSLKCTIEEFIGHLFLYFFANRLAEEN